MSSIALVTMATGRYQRFLPLLVGSASKYLSGLSKIFVLTDSRPEIDSPTDLEWLPWGRFDWPLPTLTRHRAIRSYGDRFHDVSTILHIDVDMVFVRETHFEPSPLFAVRHPGYANSARSSFPYETNQSSTSFIPIDQGSRYFAGGVQGGNTESYLHACGVLSDMVQQDLRRGIVPIWHDESAWNRLCVDVVGLLELEPSYCTPQRDLSEETKIIALDKNHRRMRRNFRR